MAAMIQVVRSSCEKTVVKEGPLALGNKDKRVEVPAAPNREVHQTTVADFTTTATAAVVVTVTASPFIACFLVVTMHRCSAFLHGAKVGHFLGKGQADEAGLAADRRGPNGGRRGVAVVEVITVTR